MRHFITTIVYLILGAIFSAASPALSAPVAELTLDQALELALRQSPSLGASRAVVAGSQARVTQARAAYLPQVGGSLGYDRRWSEARTTSSNGRDGQYDAYSASVGISQYLYDFGQTSGKMEQSRHNLTASRLELGDTIAALIREVKVRYFEALKAGRLVGVRDESLQVRQKHLEQARALYGQGLRPKIDVTKGEVDLSQARLQLLQARYARQKALTSLERILGGPPRKGPYRLAEAGPAPASPAKVGPLVAKAMEARADLSQLKTQVLAAQAGVDAVQGSFWPRLEAGGSYSFADSEFPLDQSWQAGVSLSWDIFTGFKRSGQEGEARAELHRLQALVRSKLLAVSEEVTQAYLALKEAEETVATAKVSLRQATENLAQAQGRYQAGVSNAVEFSDAQVLYTEAQSALVQATYGYRQAWAALDYAIGGGVPPLQTTAKR